jgi:hypothetical protein
MRLLSTIATSLLACGPLASPRESTTAATSDTGDTTESAPSPTTATPEPITTTTLDPTTIEPTTLDPTTTDTPFIIKPDGIVGTIECDVFKQDCDPGQKCTFWIEGGGGVWNATKCVNITGDGAPGDPCTAPGGGGTGIDDCALGSLCWDVDEDNHGICIALCTGTPDAPVCPSNSTCSITSEGVLNLCIPDCDPLIQDCAGDDLCIPSNGEFLCVLDASGEMGVVNDPCEFPNACDKGLVCLPPSDASSACDPRASGCCQPFCELPDSPCPNPDQQCLPWYDPMMEIPPGYEDVGICSIPE